MAAGMARGVADEFVTDPGPAEGSGETDAALVDRTLRGQHDAFGMLVQRYQRKAFWIAYHTLGRVEDARDVTQEAFLRLYRSLDRYDFQRNFYTWFYRIVLNLAIDQLRRARLPTHEGVEDLGEPCEGGTGLPESVEKREVSALVRQVLQRMDPRFSTVLVLRDLQGMNCRDIAPILKITHATVRWRLHRARAMFRVAWERLERTWRA
ncbi:MAG: sigma-70 family RNA polymerase sigma factor [Planctomycetes bacterium]|nr:sigma-70 family RNA polymerase sigma factor [Planctomycetota bacterium]